MTIHRVLCAVDFSAASLAAVEQAAEEARLRGAILDLLHVWQPGLEYVGDGPPIPFESELPRQRIEADLASIDVDLPAQRVCLHVTDGNPAQDIVKLAEQLSCELVVIGTHANSGFRRWIIGSVCESVLRQCPCGVLVCRGPESR